MSSSELWLASPAVFKQGVLFELGLSGAGVLWAPLLSRLLAHEWVA